MDDPQVRLFVCRLLSPCTTSPSLAELEEAVARRRVPWARVVALSSADLVTPALHGRLGARGWLPRLDDEIRTYLATVAQLNRDRNREATRQLAQVAGALNTIAVEPVVLKGAAMLVGEIHPDPADRIVGDLDLLVPRGHYRRAMQVLHEIGYRPADGRCFDHHHHSAPLLHRDWPLAVELHRDVLNAVYRERLPAPPLIGRSDPQACGEHVVRLPAPDDLFVHNVLHHQLADRKLWTLELRLRDALDLVGLAVRFPERIGSAMLADRLRRVAGRGATTFYVGGAFAAFQAPDPLARRRRGGGTVDGRDWLIQQALRVQMRTDLARLRATTDRLAHVAQIVRRGADPAQRRGLVLRARRGLLQSIERSRFRQGI